MKYLCKFLDIESWRHTDNPFCSCSKMAINSSISRHRKIVSIQVWWWAIVQTELGTVPERCFPDIYSAPVCQTLDKPVGLSRFMSGLGLTAQDVRAQKQALLYVSCVHPSLAVFSSIVSDVTSEQMLWPLSLLPFLLQVKFSIH